ncbi:phenylalanyl-tRNA synthetase subunit alpha [Candidatus Tremblaya phenacola PAVE]|nr:phenylalanyl-tRNA synthetase subunit alpha [Candidatus Tremblaya phenacola PAVE]
MRTSQNLRLHDPFQKEEARGLMFAKYASSFGLKKVIVVATQTQMRCQEGDSSLPAAKLLESSSLKMVGVGVSSLVREMCDEVEWFLRTSGFSIVSTPEIETEKNNFDVLNIPNQHPSRSSQDSYFLDVWGPEGRPLLLRTHLSASHQHFLMMRMPPLKMASIGKVFRKDDDSDHLPMFHQVEGLWIDEALNVCQLRTLLFSLLNVLFENANLFYRLRSSHFPFTAPSFELDIGLPSGSDWLEISGCGLLRPVVLSNLGVDVRKFSGLAFGLGIERLVMIREKLEDIRSLGNLMQWHNRR